MSEHDTNGPSRAENGAPDVHAGERRRVRQRVAGLLVVIAILSLLGDVLASVALGRSSPSSRATISVTGSGTTHGTPDTINFQIGVSTVAASAASALAENNARVRSLETALTGHGVTKRNMQTSNLNLYANYNNNGAVTGFTAEDDLNVTMHQLAKAGGAIDAAANAAGNGARLYGLTFSISNQSKLLATARAAAMRNAQVEASQIARAGGATLGSIVKVTDQENASPAQTFYPTAAGTASFASVPIQAGSQSINVQVSVVYALNG